MSPALALALCLAAAHPAETAAPPPAGALRLEAGTGVDGNPLREVDAGEPDAFLEVLVDATLDAGGPRRSLRLAIAEGGRVFAATPDANLLATRLEAAGAVAAGPRAAAGVTLVFRDLSEQGGVRSETGGDVLVDARASLGPVRLAAGGGFSATAPRSGSLRAFASLGPSGSLRATWVPARAHVVQAVYSVSRRAFPRWQETRADVSHGLEAEWIWRGPALLTAAYALVVNDSNIVGGAYRRHRISARTALALGEAWTLAAQGSLQRSFYPDGVFTDAALLLAQSDESQNALEVRLTRALRPGVDLFVRAGAYFSEISDGAGGRLPYERRVAQAGLAFTPGDD